MYKLLILFLSIFCFQNVNAQVKLRPELSINYLQHSKLVGIGITNGLHFPLNENSKIITSFTFSYAEGNRNFNTSTDRLPNLEYDGYTPPYQTWRVYPFGFDYVIDLDVKTSTTYQYSLNIGYAKKISKWEFGGGLYLTYINKSYLAALIPDFDITFLGDPYTIDFFVPFHIRYYDAGPFLTASRRISDKKAKLPLYVTSSIYLALKNNHSYHLGLAIDL